MSSVDIDKLLESLDPSRRSFLKSLILGTAYTTPMVTSFGMEENLEGSPAPAPLSALCSNLGSFDPNFLGTADVVINKTSSPDLVGPGEQLTFTLEVFNCGPDHADIVVVTDQLPLGARFVSSTGVNDTATNTFDITEPAVGSEGGEWVATAQDSLLSNDVAIFEIVVEILP